MTTIYLVRHGHNDWIGQGIAGRLHEVHLNERGRDEAAALGRWFERKPIAAIYSSPLERAQETAEPIASASHLPIVICEDLHEFDFGHWSGKSMAELDGLEAWKQFNAFRVATRPPGGELMLEVQARMLRFLEEASRRHPDQEVVAVSHGDPIRSAVMAIAGIPLDLYARLEISPGSVSALELTGWHGTLKLLNYLPI